ncbi:MAG: toll/interleukin-1 receptor domain-containing protein [Calditrichia bacterium]
MNERIDKPRVFLSHSSKDKPFIRKVEADLRRCQINTWLDEIDIRHGQSWLSAIFEDGLPNCDSVLVYLTKDSIESEMVKKEMDAGILGKLNDGNVSFLPYVSDSKLRSALRIDLQGLHVLEWNEDNYYELLPVIVAEIWRSYTERRVAHAVQSEKVRRLEAELELEKTKSDSPFSGQEDAEFENIYRKTNRSLSFSVIFFGKVDNPVDPEDYEFEDREIGTKHYQFNMLGILKSLGYHKSVSSFDLNLLLTEKSREVIKKRGIERAPRINFEPNIIIEEFLKLGLFNGYPDDCLVEREKYYRLKNWCDYYDKEFPELVLEEIDPSKECTNTPPPT